MRTAPWSELSLREGCLRARARGLPPHSCDRRWPLPPSRNPPPSSFNPPPATPAPPYPLFLPSAGEGGALSRSVGHDEAEEEEDESTALSRSAGPDDASAGALGRAAGPSDGHPEGHRLSGAGSTGAGSAHDDLTDTRLATSPVGLGGIGLRDHEH